MKASESFQNSAKRSLRVSVLRKVNCPVTVEFNFEEPFRAVRQVRDGGAVHWLDEIRVSFRNRRGFCFHLVRIRHMPLDEIGRRYADSFYQRRLHEISPTQPQRIGALRNQHASRGSIRSSGYIREHYKLLFEDIDSLAQAKLEGLIKAYEKSGMPFNEAAFYDVKQQIVDFCQSEQHKLIGSMNKTVGQFLGGVSFEPFAKEIVAEIDAIIGRLVCDLEMRRDEAILEDRRTKKAYAAGLGKQWDTFICHASEDKKDFVASLRGDCTIRGLRFGTTLSRSN